MQRATLRLWVQANGGTVDGPELRTTTDVTWSEAAITWNTRPAPTPAPPVPAVADLGKLTGSTWAAFDVTSVVTGNGAVGFVLLPQVHRRCRLRRA